MSMGNLLEQYVKLMLETGLARVPQQLVSSETDGQSGNSDNGEEAEDVNEFSGASGAAGYTLPLGMDPDAAGRKKNSSR